MIMLQLDASSPKESFEENKNKGRDDKREAEGLLEKTLERHRYNEGRLKRLELSDIFGCSK